MQSPFGRNTGRYPRENVQAWDKVGRARFPIRDMTLFPLSVRHARIKDIFICACETVFPGRCTRDETVVLRDHLILFAEFRSRPPFGPASHNCTGNLIQRTITKTKFYVFGDSPHQTGLNVWNFLILVHIILDTIKS